MNTKKGRKMGREMGRMWKSRRAEEVEETPEAPNYSIYFMIAGAIIALFAVFLVIATSTYQVEVTSILGNLESTVMEFRILNSPDCFIYQDPVTKRAYPHVIDLERFTEESVMRCISPSSVVCFECELEVGGNVVGTVESQNYRFPQDIKVTLWPVKVRIKDGERQGFMRISTSKTCMR